MYEINRGSNYLRLLGTFGNALFFGTFDETCPFLDF